MVNERVKSLVTEFQTRLEAFQNMPSGLKIDHAYWRKRFRGLLGNTFDEPSRIALLDGYALVLDLVACEIAENGNDPSFFRKVRASIWRGLCLEEAIYENNGGVIRPGVFEAIVEREFTSGRMQENVFSCDLEIAAEQLKDRTDFISLISSTTFRAGRA